MKRILGSLRRLLGLRADAPLVRTLDAPPAVPEGERIYVVGDIHGRADLLRRLLNAIGRDSATRPPARGRMIVLGDFIDRGGESAAAARLLMRMDLQLNAVTVLKGNHEATLLDVLNGDFEALDFWLAHGGRASLASWNVPEELTEPCRERELVAVLRDRIGAEMIGWLAGLPTHVIRGDYLFVHAGIRPGIPVGRQKPHDLLWIREPFLQHDGQHEFVVVHGHTIVEDGPRHYGNRIAVDTGAYLTGQLGALGLQGYDHWTVRS